MILIVLRYDDDDGDSDAVGKENVYLKTSQNGNEQDCGLPDVQVEGWRDLVKLIPCI